MTVVASHECHRRVASGQPSSGVRVRVLDSESDSESAPGRLGVARGEGGRGEAGGLPLPPLALSQPDSESDSAGPSRSRGGEEATRTRSGEWASESDSGSIVAGGSLPDSAAGGHD